MANQAWNGEIRSEDDNTASGRQAAFFADDPGPLGQKIESFAKFASRQSLGRFLVRYELYRHIMEVAGSVVECGVFDGAGVMAWAKLSAILEPNNYSRRVIGFDTFTGFPQPNQERDVRPSANPGAVREGELCGSSLENIMRAVALHDMGRHIAHIPKVELVQGLAEETIPKYVADNPHLVVSLLYLDFDLFDATLAALKTFLPRMPKGAVVAFDELNFDLYPGETAAVMKAVGIRNLRIRRFPFDTLRSYAILE